MYSAIYDFDARNRLSDVHLQVDMPGEAPAVVLQDYVGRTLSSFLSDPETAHIYELLLDRVRRSQTPVSFDWRCDDAGQRRYMRMHLRPLADGAVGVNSELLRVETRPLQPILNATVAAPGGATLMVCGWCARLHVGGERWEEVEEAVQALALWEAPLPQIGHGICPECRRYFLGLADPGATG